MNIHSFDMERLQIGMSMYVAKAIKKVQLLIQSKPEYAISKRIIAVRALLFFPIDWREQ